VFLFSYFHGCEYCFFVITNQKLAHKREREHQKSDGFSGAPIAKKGCVQTMKASV